jgi:transcriptional regulator with GAF, ATPase, and Fis domain
MTPNTDNLQQNTIAPRFFVGESRAMHDLVQRVMTIATVPSTILIYGETGTGKELVARAIHQNSKRSAGPFIPINCACLSEDLLESQLFGHEKGSFTGAFARQKGKFELASGGTLFLDEVSELAPANQVKLLRALQERRVDRLGSGHSIPVDARFITATNRDLKAEVATGRFREDLYYRLEVVTLRIPPLRERPRDIAALARHFAVQFGKRIGRNVTGVAPKTIAILEGLYWPGNVRQLENAIESAVVEGKTSLVLPKDLPDRLFQDQPFTATNGSLNYLEGTRKFQHNLVSVAFERAHGDYKAAAQLLGLEPKSMHRLIRKLDLDHLLKRTRRTARSSDN